MKISQSIAGFVKAGVRGIWFCKNTDRYVYEFLIRFGKYRI